MMANVLTWIRAFRLPLQRAYPRLEETPDAIDADFADLLRSASERMADDSETPPDDNEAPHKNRRN